MNANENLQKRKGENTYGRKKYPENNKPVNEACRRNPEMSGPC